MQYSNFNYCFSTPVVLLLPSFPFWRSCYLFTQTSKGQNNWKFQLSEEKWYLLQPFTAFFLICHCQINSLINKVNFFIWLAARLVRSPFLVCIPDLIKVLACRSNKSQSPAHFSQKAGKPVCSKWPTQAGSEWTTSLSLRGLFVSCQYNWEVITFG